MIESPSFSPSIRPSFRLTVGISISNSSSVVGREGYRIGIQLGVKRVHPLEPRSLKRNPYRPGVEIFCLGIFLFLVPLYTCRTVNRVRLLFDFISLLWVSNDSSPTELCFFFTWYQSDERTRPELFAGFFPCGLSPEP